MVHALLAPSLPLLPVDVRGVASLRPVRVLPSSIRSSRGSLVSRVLVPLELLSALPSVLLSQIPDLRYQVAVHAVGKLFVAVVDALRAQACLFAVVEVVKHVDS